MWDFLEAIHGRPFHKGLSVVDPACGDGVFLRTVADHAGLSAASLFGVDIDETLMPLWRRDPLVRAAKLYRANGLLDNPNIGFVEGLFDVVVGNPPFSGRGMRDLLKLVEDSTAAQRHEEADLFAQPGLQERHAPPSPPSPRHERTVLDYLVRQLSRYSCWQLGLESEDEDHDLAGGLADDLFAGFEFSSRRRVSASDYERMAQFVANWSPERLLDVTRPEVRDIVRRLAGTAIEVFFIERFVRLAKPGGLIAAIVPQSIVAGQQLAPLRTWLLTQMDLLASVGLPRKLFTGVGANAKTTIVFARRLAAQAGKKRAPAGAADESSNAAADRMVFLAAPSDDTEGAGLETYLASVMDSARRNRDIFHHPAIPC
jgi:hypothetical protein